MTPHSLYNVHRVNTEDAQHAPALLGTVAASSPREAARAYVHEALPTVTTTVLVISAKDPLDCWMCTIDPPKTPSYTVGGNRL